MNKISNEPIDLSAVEPALRETVRHRLQAIHDFGREPGRRNAEKHASQLGLSPAAFYNLVKAWQTLRDPLRISGRTRPRTKTIGIDDDVQPMLDRVIRDHPELPTVRLASLAIDAIRGNGLTLPTRSKVLRYVAKHRPRTLPPEIVARGNLVVEYTVIELPVFDEVTQCILRPLVTAVVDTRANVVCDLHLSHGGPTAATIAAALRSVTHARSDQAVEPHSVIATRIGMPMFHDPNLPELVASLEQCGFVVSQYPVGAYGHGKAIEALYGQITDGLRFAPRLVMASSDRRATKLKAGRTAIALTAAEGLVRARLGISGNTCAYPRKKITPSAWHELHIELNPINSGV